MTHIIIGNKIMDSVIGSDSDFIENLRRNARQRVEERKRAFKKTGRNDPCPCGSGKKFKKCCLERRG